METEIMETAIIITASISILAVAIWVSLQS